MTKLSELNERLEHIRKLQKRNREVERGMVYSINLLNEHLVEIRRLINERTELIIKLNNEAEGYRL